MENRESESEREWVSIERLDSALEARPTPISKETTKENKRVDGQANAKNNSSVCVCLFLKGGTSSGH